MCPYTLHRVNKAFQLTHKSFILPTKIYHTHRTTENKLVYLIQQVATIFNNITNKITCPSAKTHHFPDVQYLLHIWHLLMQPLLRQLTCTCVYCTSKSLEKCAKSPKTSSMDVFLSMQKYLAISSYLFSMKSYCCINISKSFCAFWRNSYTASTKAGKRRVKFIHCIHTTPSMFFLWVCILQFPVTRFLGLP